MRQPIHQNDKDTMRAEYDFSHAVRGKTFAAYRAGTNVVFLDPDVARAFVDSAAVNQALGLLLKLAQASVPSRRETAKAQPATRAPRRTRKPKAARATRG